MWTADDVQEIKITLIADIDQRYGDDAFVSAVGKMIDLRLGDHVMLCKLTAVRITDSGTRAVLTLQVGDEDTNA